jgi:hypothetical protein
MDGPVQVVVATVDWDAIAGALKVIGDSGGQFALGMVVGAAIACVMAGILYKFSNGFMIERMKSDQERIKWLEQQLNLKEKRLAKMHEVLARPRTATHKAEGFQL